MSGVTLLTCDHPSTLASFTGPNRKNGSAASVLLAVAIPTCLEGWRVGAVLFVDSLRGCA